MTALLTFVLLLTATTAHADHVWRMWCGDPPTPRAGVYDGSAECWREADDTYVQDHCQDTDAGPRYMGEHVPPWDKAGLRTCAEVRKHNANCGCRPETVP